MKKNSSRLLMNLLLCTFLIILLFQIAYAVPVPHNIRGRVFNSDGITGVENGIPININDTNSSYFLRTYVSAPPVPAFKGSYAAVINGSDNDSIIVTAWNGTYYGINDTEILVSGTTTINVVLNILRPSETNLTIIEPSNNTLYDITTLFNVTVNVSVIGGQNGGDCNATISFTDGNVLRLFGDGTYTNGIGSIALGSYNLTYWTVIANKTGVSNITVRAQCANDGKNFDEANIKIVSNITVRDIYSPVISLEYPENNSILNLFDISFVTFRYNVSDGSDIANCSLIINNRINQTNYTVSKSISQSFSVPIINGTYFWSVNCSDNSTSNNVGASPTYNLTIIPNFLPVVTMVYLDETIDLNPGLTKRITCNATITDQNNISDIVNVNATFYSSVSYHSDQDDNNYHYTNESCSLVDSGLYEGNYTCTFDLQYYSNNGTWVCNVTASDVSNAFDHLNRTSIINELIAIDVSPLAIDYGNLAPTSTSTQDVVVNITNIGNIPFNTTLDGFGRSDGDDLAMMCDKGNVSIGNERYSIFSDMLYDDMIQLRDVATQINITFPQRTDENYYGSDRNYTYWKLMLPIGIQGSCNGTVTFITVPI